MEKERKTVTDIVKENPNTPIVMVQRHFTYLTGHVDVWQESVNLSYARNLSDITPSVMFLCDKEGINLGWEQGKKYANAGIEISEIITSHQGRGPDSGIRIAEGIFEKTGNWIPVKPHKMADYPNYAFNSVYECLEKDALDESVVEWLNGKRKELVASDTPKSFLGRVTGLVEDLLEKPGLRIISTHYELTLLAHCVYVEKKKLGEIPQGWSPVKGGGVLLVKKGEKLEAYDYDPNLCIV